MKTESKPNPKGDLAKLLSFLSCAFVFAVIALALVFILDPIGHRQHLSNPIERLSKPTLKLAAPDSLAELLTVAPEHLAKYEIAWLNLLCAEDLPGAEDIKINEMPATLDQWAHRVKSETDRHLYRFRANPAEYDNSEAYFRMLIMAVVFYEDFNIRYNPGRVAIPSSDDLNDKFFADSRDIFIHGLIGSRRMGTCSSMPVLYLAVGRRLGYPLKLVTTKAHLFLRWEDANERFDLEATGKGMSRYDDEHFKQWPFPVTDEEVRTEHYLKSLTPAEELAVFLSLRANCLKEAGKIAEAAECYETALRFAPDWNSYRVLLASARDIKGKTVLSAIDKPLVQHAPTTRLR